MTRPQRNAVLRHPRGSGRRPAAGPGLLLAVLALGVVALIATLGGGSRPGSDRPVPPAAAPDALPPLTAAQRRAPRTRTGAVRAYKSLWIAPSTIARLPTSGPAWTFLQRVARGDLGEADVADQADMHGTRVFGVALVYARTGDPWYRGRARSAIMSAIGTERGARSLALGRNLAPYVLAADLINLENMSARDGARFRTWISALRTRRNAGNDRWPTLIETSDNTSSNWGAFATASRMAIDLYLGDRRDLRRAARIHRAYADRSAYPAGEPWGSYFEPTADFDPDAWSCGSEADWVAINPPCVKNGFDIDGALVEDISRERSEQTRLPQEPGSDGMSYSWETLQAIVVQAELLRRAGYPNLWTLSDRALERATAFMLRAGWQADSGVVQYVPWVVNVRYGTRFPTAPAEYGRIMGFTDWTHGPRPNGGRS